MSKPTLQALISTYTAARAAAASDAVVGGSNVARSYRLQDASNDAFEACIEACLAVADFAARNAAFAQLDAAQGE